MKSSGRNIALSSYDDIFSTEADRQEEQDGMNREKVQMLPPFGASPVSQPPLQSQG